MPRRKIFLMCLLSNTNQSILRVKLSNDFKIEGKPSHEVNKLLSTLENIPQKIVTQRSVRTRTVFIPEGKTYLISNSFDVDIKRSKQKISINIINAIDKFHNELFLKYLSPTIRLMRLFKEGNIYIPMIYYFFFDNNTPMSISRTQRETYISPGPIYNVNKAELPDLQIFIQKTKIPFTEPYLQFAFENFELSYHTSNINLSFLALMIGLECLFNPKEQYELTYTISRNTAALIGKNKADSELIFKNMKKLYNKRSRIVHSGKSNIININDLLILRDYVRRSIKEFNKIGKGKEEVLDMLNSSGFGERIRIQKKGK